MITLLLAAFSGSQFQLIMGILISSLELLYVLLNIIAVFVDPSSKFGKVLSKICLGLSRVISHDFSKTDDNAATTKDEGGSDDDSDQVS